MRVFVYSLAVTVATVAGLFIINVAQFMLLNPGTSLIDAAGSVAFAIVVLLPVVLFYMLAVAGVMGVIRRRTWWAGALAGFVPALVFYGLSAWMDSGSTYIGTAEELATATTVNGVFAVLSICWCTIAGAVFFKLARASNDLATSSVTTDRQ